MMKKLTPVVIVDAIEPVLPFWEALGFTRTAEVPHGDRLGFVILAAGAVEVMFQTVDSVCADEAAVLSGKPFGANALYLEVENLDAIAVPPGASVLTERRKTFYGATETILRDP